MFPLICESPHEKKSLATLLELLPKRASFPLSESEGDIVMCDILALKGPSSERGSAIRQQF